MLKDRKITICSLIATAVMLMLMAGVAWADIHLKLISGKRTIKDKVSFTIEVDREKNENPRNAKAPDFIKFLTTFAEPASGVILLDGKGVLRFDGTNQAISGDIEITYGRHEVTLQVTSPAVVTLLDVSVRGAVISEAVGASAGASAGGSAEDRITALEQKVKQLEAEIEALKKERRNR
jgi:hypothetical protein